MKASSLSFLNTSDELRRIQEQIEVLRKDSDHVQQRILDLERINKTHKTNIFNLTNKLNTLSESSESTEVLQLYSSSSTSRSNDNVPTASSEETDARNDFILCNWSTEPLLTLSFDTPHHAPTIHSSGIFGVHFSPVEDFLVAGCVDGRIGVWKLHNYVNFTALRRRRSLTDTLIEQFPASSVVYSRAGGSDGASISTVRWNAVGNRIFAGTYDGSVSVFSFVSERNRSHMLYRTYNVKIEDTASVISSEYIGSSTIYFGCSNGVLYKLSEGNHSKFELEAVLQTSAGLNSLCLVSDTLGCNYLLSGDSDGHVSLIRITHSVECVWRKKIANGAPILRAVVCEKVNLLAVLCMDSTLQVFLVNWEDVVSLTLIYATHSHSRRWPVNCAFLCPNSSGQVALLTTATKGRAYIHLINSVEAHADPVPDALTAIRRVSSRHTLLAKNSNSLSKMGVDVPKFFHKSSLLQKIDVDSRDSQVLALSVHPSKPLFATGSTDGFIKLWKPES